MSASLGFTFNSVADLPPLSGSALVGFVPKDITNAKDLLQAVAESLNFPAYFGLNWNALYDCLRDFHWTDKKNIFLIHADLPSLPVDELRTYLETLRDAAADWGVNEPHVLKVVFDTSVEEDIKK